MTTPRSEADREPSLPERSMEPSREAEAAHASTDGPQAMTSSTADAAPAPGSARAEPETRTPETRTPETRTARGKVDEPDPNDRTATQVLPADSASGAADDETSRVVPAGDDDATVTRPMPAVDSEAIRSTDRDAARARAEARFRPADDPYENTHASPGAAPGYSEAAAGSAPATVEREPQVIRRIVRGKPTTDRFNGALALFVLRLVVAAVMAAHGGQKLINLGATREFFGRTQIPYPEWAALATGVGEVLIAGALLIGLLVRVAGLGLLIISIGALVFVQWAPFTPFRPDVSGFVGEKELVLAAVGLLFLLVGGGGWGADRIFRSAKSKGQVEEDEA